MQKILSTSIRRMAQLMKEIYLTKGKKALVDDEDFDKLNRLSWYALEGKHGNFYAARHSRRKSLLMHTYLLSPPKGFCVDHIDGNGLNNCKDNLRISSAAQNQANRKVVLSMSGYKGVSKIKRGYYKNPWRAKIKVNGKIINLGYFETAEEAARAYDKAATLHFGEFAYLNFRGII